MTTDINKNKEKEEEEYVRQTGSLKERLGRVKTTRWWRFGIVALIYVLWTIWMGNPWLLLGLILLGDIYLTQFLPWGAWKGLKNKTLKTIMSWVDAIIYALVLVYFLFLFVGQNYQIPSSSLEKSLLTGDFLWVNKVTYGPRVPQTPLHFPLAQNTLPFFNCKSYIETPQLSYHRLKGLRNVERMDIVVFNFPAGDTVTLNCPNPDYYTSCYDYGRDASFATFADLCVSRQMYSAIQASARKKHSPLNGYISIYAKREGAEEDSDVALEDMLEANSNFIPEQHVINQENLSDLEEAIEKQLSPLERQVLDLYVTGMSVKEISAVLSRDEKSTDNAMQRIRHKLKGYLNS